MGERLRRRLLPHVIVETLDVDKEAEAPRTAFTPTAKLQGKRPSSRDLTPPASPLPSERKSVLVLEAEAMHAPARLLSPSSPVLTPMKAPGSLRKLSAALSGGSWSSQLTAPTPPVSAMSSASTDIYSRLQLMASAEARSKEKSEQPKTDAAVVEAELARVPDVGADARQIQGRLREHKQWLRHLQRRRNYSGPSRGKLVRQTARDPVHDLDEGLGQRMNVDSPLLSSYVLGADGASRKVADLPKKRGFIGGRPATAAAAYGSYSSPLASSLDRSGERQDAPELGGDEEAYVPLFRPLSPGGGLVMPATPHSHLPTRLPARPSSPIGLATLRPGTAAVDVMPLPSLASPPPQLYGSPVRDAARLDAHASMRLPSDTGRIMPPPPSPAYHTRRRLRLQRHRAASPIIMRSSPSAPLLASRQLLQPVGMAERLADSVAGRHILPAEYKRRALAYGIDGRKGYGWREAVYGPFRELASPRAAAADGSATSLAMARHGASPSASAADLDLLAGTDGGAAAAAAGGTAAAAAAAAGAAAAGGAGRSSGSSWLAGKKDKALVDLRALVQLIERDPANWRLVTPGKLRAMLDNGLLVREGETLAVAARRLGMPNRIVEEVQTYAREGHKGWSSGGSPAARRAAAGKKRRGGKKREAAPEVDAAAVAEEQAKAAKRRAKRRLRRERKRLTRGQSVRSSLVWDMDASALDAEDDAWFLEDDDGFLDASDSDSDSDSDYDSDAVDFEDSEEEDDDGSERKLSHSSSDMSTSSARSGSPSSRRSGSPSGKSTSMTGSGMRKLLRVASTRSKAALWRGRARKGGSQRKKMTRAQRKRVERKKKKKARQAARAARLKALRDMDEMTKERKRLEAMVARRERAAMWREEWDAARVQWWGSAVRRTPMSWVSLRVFISSTFNDMHGERDYLTRITFPQINSKVRGLRVRMIPVDLRWGLTAEDTSNDGLGALEMCLREVDRCRPFFLAILGSRYGWMPDEYKISDKPELQWVKHFPPNHSITALEIQHGFLRKPYSPTYAFAMFRNARFLKDVPKSERRVFAFDYPRKSRVKKRRDAMLDAIEAHKFCVTHRYTCEYGGKDKDGKLVTSELDGFGTAVYESMLAAIRREFEIVDEDKDADDLSRERLFHSHHHSELTASFFGRQRDVQLIFTAFRMPPESAEANRPLLIVGGAGSGKSSLVATYCSELQNKRGAAVYVLYHFVGASPASLDARKMMLRIVHELRAAFSLRLPSHGSDYTSVKELLNTTLELASGAARRFNRTLTIVVDGVDQMSRHYNPQSLDWLPDGIPTNIRLVMTATEGAAVVEVARGLRFPIQILPELEVEVRRQILTSALAQYSKKLTPDQMAVAMGKSGSSRPLYLLMICEELRFHGQYGIDGEGVTNKIRELPPEMPALFAYVLDRLETEAEVYGAGDGGASGLSAHLIRETMTLLECSRQGLLEMELLELLAPPGQPTLSQSVWLRLSRSLGAYLRLQEELDDCTLDFFHNQMSTAVRMRYFHSIQDECATFKKLAAYFYSKCDPFVNHSWAGPSGHIFDNLAYYQVRAHCFLELKQTLGSLSFLRSRAAHGRAALEQLVKAYMDTVGYVESAAYQSIKDALLEADFTRHSLLKYVQDFGEFVQSQLDSLLAFPKLLFQLALNQPEWSAPNVAARSWIGTPRATDIFFEWINKPELNRILSGFSIDCGCTCGHRVSEEMVVIGDTRGKVRVLNPLTSEVLNVVTMSESCEATALALSKDSSMMLLGAADGRLLYAGVLGAVDADLEGHSKRINSVTIHPNGRFMASASADKTVRIWGDTSVDGSEESKLGELHCLKSRRPPNVIQYSPNGERLVQGNSDGSLIVWDSTGQTLGLMETSSFRAHFTGVSAVVFHPNSRLLVTGGEDSDIKVWKLDGTLRHTLPNHQGRVTTLSFDSSAKRLLSAAVDRKIMVWDMEAVELELELLGHSHDISSAQWTEDGNHLQTFSMDASVKLWNAKRVYRRRRVVKPIIRGKRVAAITAGSGEHLSGVTSLTFSRTGHLVVVTYSSAVIRIIDADSGRVAFVLHGHMSPVLCAALSDDALWLLSGDASGAITVWSGDAYATPRALTSGKDDVGGIFALAVSSDKSFVCAGGQDGTILVWKSLRKLAVNLSHATKVTGLQYTADALISSAADGSIHMWHPTTFVLLRVLQGGNPSCVFSCLQRGRRAIVASSEPAAIQAWMLVDPKLLHRKKKRRGPRKKSSATSSTGVSSLKDKLEQRRSKRRTSVATKAVELSLGTSTLRTARAPTTRSRTQLTLPSLSSGAAYYGDGSDSDDSDISGARSSLASISSKAASEERKRDPSSSFSRVSLDVPASRSRRRVLLPGAVSSALLRDRVIMPTADQPLAGLSRFYCQTAPLAAALLGDKYLIAGVGRALVLWEVGNRTDIIERTAFCTSAAITSLATFGRKQVIVGDASGEVYVLQLQLNEVKQRPLRWLDRESRPYTLRELEDIPEDDAPKRTPVLMTENVRLRGRDKPAARLVRLPGGARPDVGGAAVVDRLRLAPEAVICCFGGASGLDPLLVPVLASALGKGVVQAARAGGALLITGGTDCGVMKMIGMEVALDATRLRLLGIVPKGLCTLPGEVPPHEEASPLEPHHTDFLLVHSSDWGGETEMMVDGVACHLSKQRPVICVAANGGGITVKEIWYAVKNGFPLVLIEGSGRSTDKLAALWRKKMAGTLKDDDIDSLAIRHILKYGRIYLFKLGEPAAFLKSLLLRVLSEHAAA